MSGSKTLYQVYDEGVVAAHDLLTPTCPYNEHDSRTRYIEWYRGLVDERTKIEKSNPTAKMGELIDELCIQLERANRTIYLIPRTKETNKLLDEYFNGQNERTQKLRRLRSNLG